MTEEQADEIIDLLKSIDDRVVPTWDAHDICNKLDEVRSDLDEMQKKLADCVQYLANIDRNTEL